MFKIRLKATLAATLALIGFFLFNFDVEANSMSILDYTIELQPDGSGIVTEYRQMHLSEGTEVYLVFSDLEGSELTDIHVSDFGESFTYQENWDINDSREAKAGKYGLISTEDGYELSLGDRYVKKKYSYYIISKSSFYSDYFWMWKNKKK